MFIFSIRGNAQPEVRPGSRWQLMKEGLAYVWRQKIVFGAAVDARRKIAVIKRLSQPIDHPVSLHHPEGEYLKGLALRALD